MSRPTCRAPTSPTSTCTARLRCGAIWRGCAPSPTSRPMADVPEPVLIVGAGLLGTSLGLALRRHDVEVLLTDRHPEQVRTATGLGAGREYGDERPGLVV